VPTVATISEAIAELHEIQDSFEAAPVDVRDDMETVTSKIGHLIEAGAKKRAPVRTGLLRSSITTNLTSEAESVSAEVYTDTFYAVYQELGTRYIQPPNAFLGPSFDELQQPYVDALLAIIPPKAFR
jgi:HK97 gp10 family phage protein